MGYFPKDEQRWCTSLVMNKASFYPGLKSESQLSKILFLVFHIQFYTKCYIFKLIFAYFSPFPLSFVFSPVNYLKIFWAIIFTSAIISSKMQIKSHHTPDWNLSIIFHCISQGFPREIELIGHTPTYYPLPQHTHRHTGIRVYVYLS